VRRMSWKKENYQRRKAGRNKGERGGAKDEEMGNKARVKGKL